MDSDPEHVSQLIVASAGGERTALEELMPIVYDELRRIALRFLGREREGHTLQPTALVNEAYVRLVGQNRLGWQDRAHFVGIAARQMRHILVDHARTRGRQKRGGGAVKVELEEVAAPSGASEVDLIALDDALRALSAVDEQMGRV